MALKWHYRKQGGIRMIERQTEQLHPLGAGLHKKADAEVLHAVLTGQQQALACLQGCFSDLIHVADAGAKALGAGRKLAYAGAGSSGLMALADSLEPDTAQHPPRRSLRALRQPTLALRHLQPRRSC